MAEDLVISGIKIETAELLAGQKRIESALKQIETKASTMDRTVQRSGRQFDALGKKVAGLAAAYITFRGAFNLGRSLIDTNRELQDLQANLTTVTGSAGKATQVFRDITDFARTTPFEIKGLTEAFVRLQAFGAGPTIEQFRGLGNVSAAFSRDITTLTDAIVSAVNTSTEPIRAFGVQASIAGDKMTVSFQGVTKTLPRTTAALSAFLAEAGNTGQFAGAMERRMNTLGGAISNLSDVVTIFAKDIGEQGLNREIIATVQQMTAAIQESDDLARSLGQGAAGGVRLLSESIRVALPVMSGFANLLARIGDQAGRVAAPDIARVRGFETADQVNRAAAEAFRKQQDLQRQLAEVEGRFPAGFDPDRVSRIARAVVPPGIGQIDPIRRLVRERDKLIDQISGQDLIIQESVSRKREIIEAAAAGPDLATALLGLGGGAGAAKAKAEIDPIADALDKLAEDLRGVAAMRDALAGTSIEFDVNAEAAKAYESALNALTRIEGVNKDLVAEMAGNYVGLEDAVRRAAKAEEQRAAALEAHRNNLQRHEEAVRGFKQRQHEISDQKMLAELERQKQLAEDIATSFSDAFASIITGTETVADAFRKMAEDIISQMIRISIQRQFIDPLIASLFPHPFIASGGTVDLGGPGGGLAHFAAGGPMTAGQTALVGERGPELFTAPSAGRITPNHELGGGGSQVIVQAPVVLQSQNIDNRSAGQLYEQSAHKIASEVVRVIERNASMRRRIGR